MSDFDTLRTFSGSHPSVGIASRFAEPAVFFVAATFAAATAVLACVITTADRPRV